MDQNMFATNEAPEEVKEKISDSRGTFQEARETNNLLNLTNSYPEKDI